MITTLKLSLVGWLINLVKWKSIANESTAVWHFSIQFKLKSPTIIISQLLREGTLETWPPEQRNCKCRKEWAESGAMMELLEMNSAWTAQPRQHRGWGGGVCKRCWSAVPYSWVQPCFSLLGRQEFLSFGQKVHEGSSNRRAGSSSREEGGGRGGCYSFYFKFSQIWTINSWAVDATSVYLELSTKCMLLLLLSHLSHVRLCATP